MAKTTQNARISSVRAPAGGPTVQRRSARVAERQASSQSSASVPHAPGQSRLSPVTESQPSQPSASPIFSPESPVLPTKSPSPQSFGCQSRQSCPKLLPSRPPFLQPTPPSPKPLFSQCSVLSKFPLLLSLFLILVLLLSPQ